MPEGDTVYRAAQRLHTALAGDVLERFDLRVPQLATADLAGQRLHSVVPRGKHILARIGDWTLHSHLKMEGEWLVLRRGERWPRQAFRARAVLATARREAVGVDLADLALVPTADEHTLVGHLGPDPLSEHWDPDAAAQNLASDPREIHVALLDQRHVAGFGNVYANEVLFVRGIHPETPANTVDTVGLVALGARMLRLNRDRPARTFTGENRPGARTWVYRREGKPCRRCGSSILGTTLGADPTRERIVFWCPVCQR